MASARQQRFWLWVRNCYLGWPWHWHYTWHFLTSLEQGEHFEHKHFNKFEHLESGWTSIFDINFWTMETSALGGKHLLAFKLINNFFYFKKKSLSNYFTNSLDTNSCKEFVQIFDTKRRIILQLLSNRPSAPFHVKKNHHLMCKKKLFTIKIIYFVVLKCVVKKEIKKSLLKL